MTVAVINDVDRARRLLKSAARAAEQLESDVRELVAMRAWEVLGYENFSEMWQQENGFACPTVARALVIQALMDEGMRGQGRKRLDGSTKPGHTAESISELVGYAVSVRASNGTPAPTTVQAIIQQLKQGVPPELVVTGKRGGLAEYIEKFGTPRARSKPRRRGKSADEFVAAGFNVTRGDDDQISEIARKANTTKAEIYRQAVAEYLARYHESRGEADG